jgi:hypothetical protein
MSQPLQLVHPTQKASEAEKTSVKTEFRLDGSLLQARFDVRSSAATYLNTDLAVGSSQWGLWDWDVVELFVSVDGSEACTPYFEFQVSPLAQFLELKIIEPRKNVDRGFISGFGYAAKRLSETDWSAEMQIPLDRLGWKGDVAMIRGNAFAILGAPPARSYWSLFLGPQEKPDFHLPREFRPLLAY